MKSKHFIPITVLLATFCGAVGVSASEKVIIPDYECIINDSSVYYADSVYPLLSYKNITYFPMTYEYCRALTLTSSYSETEGLFIAYHPGNPCSFPVYETVSNVRENDAVIPEYPIYINGRKIDNKNAEYPLLNFRGITYFPMTWDYAVNEFGWTTSWEPGIFTVNASIYQSQSQSISIAEEMADGVVFGINDFIFAPGFGGYSASESSSYKKLDFATEKLTDLQDYVRPVIKTETSNRSVDITVDEEKGEVYADGVLLPEVCDFTRFDPSEFESHNVRVSAWIETLNGVDFMTVNERFSAWRKDGSGLGTNVSYIYFIEENGTPHFIGTFLTPISAVKTESGTYFTLRGYGQATFKHYMTSSTLCRFADGVITNINDTFPDHNSVNLIGAANGKLYLKCEWCPQPMSLEYCWHDVSAINDGYFEYDGTSLKKVGNYVYSDYDVLSPDGKIWAVSNRNLSVIKVN